jgi:V/A-type H+-transporting ATPase subunit K
MELNPVFFARGGYRAWYRPGLIANLVMFVGGLVALGIIGIPEAMATTEAAGDVTKAPASVGLGLELFAIAFPTAISVLGAGMAVAKIGSAALAVVVEKPEAFGQTLIYLGLAEGLAIYGLVLSILMLGRL